MTRTSKTSANRKYTGTYTAISNNIYYDGTSYRVRISIYGVMHSKNFSSKRNAVLYRNQLTKG